jgi:hypothetical protein
MNFELVDTGVLKKLHDDLEWGENMRVPCYIQYSVFIYFIFFTEIRFCALPGISMKEITKYF